MTKGKKPATPAIRALRSAGIEHELCPYDYVERGGTAHSSGALGVPEHLVVKTLIMETDTGSPVVVLMHGDREVSTRALARVIGTKSVRPCDPNAAQKHSGYLVGGTSPFGTRKLMPVYMESTIAALDRIWINAGRRGLLMAMNPKDAVELLRAQLVEIATSKSD